MKGRSIFLSSRRVFRTTTYRNGSLRLLSSEFERAQSALKTLPEDPGNEAKLLLYSYFKQGTIGDITTPSPSMFDMVGKAKHNAWSELSGMSKEDARPVRTEIFRRAGAFHKEVHQR